MKHQSLLSAVQQRLVALYGPNHYYTTKYSGEEAGYVGAIPAWLYQRRGMLGDVLDIGPGYGALACLASTLGPKSVTTLDRVPYISNEVADEFKLIVLLGDIERNCPTLATDTYDTIVMTEVVEHLNYHPLPTFQKIAASLRPKGLFMISTPDRDSWGPLTKYYKELGDMKRYDESMVADEWKDAHIWHYSESELRCMLGFAGFIIIGWETSVSAGGKHFNIGMYKP